MINEHKLRDVCMCTPTKKEDFETILYCGVLKDEKDPFPPMPRALYDECKNLREQDQNQFQFSRNKY